MAGPLRNPVAQAGKQASRETLPGLLVRVRAHLWEQWPPRLQCYADLGADFSKAEFDGQKMTGSAFCLMRGS
jgi:hypothetical protein